MRHNWIKAGVWVCTLSVVSLAVAQSGLPPDRYVRYRIHSDPTNTESAVVWDIILQLVAKQRNEQQVGWEVETITFHHLTSENDPVSWSNVAPPVGTPDGLWWVEHLDADQPQTDEFLQPPPMSGVGLPLDPANGQLTYSIAGVPNLLPGPFEHTAALTYSFSADDPPTSAEEEDEVAEGDSGPHSPPA